MTFITYFSNNSLTHLFLSREVTGPIFVSFRTGHIHFPLELGSVDGGLGEPCGSSVACLLMSTVIFMVSAGSVKCTLSWWLWTCKKVALRSLRIGIGRFTHVWLKIFYCPGSLSLRLPLASSLLPVSYHLFHPCEQFSLHLIFPLHYFVASPIKTWHVSLYKCAYWLSDCFCFASK